MKTIKLADAIASVDENLLYDVLSERYERNTRPVRHFSRGFAAKIVAASAVVVLCTAFAFVLPHSAQTPPADFSNEVSAENESSAGNESGRLPEHVPAFSTPDLEKLYAEEPFSLLLPHKIPDSLQFKSSYKVESDPIVCPDPPLYLALCFTGEGQFNSLEISVYEAEENIKLADPTDPATYDLSLYYGSLKAPSAVGADASKIIGNLSAEDISLEIVKKRMYLFDDGLCKCEISILCGTLLVHYCYNGPELPAEEFYSVVTSSAWFD